MEENNIQKKEYRNNEKEIIEILAFLWKKKIVIISFILFFLVCGILYIKFIRTYTAIYEIKPISTYQIRNYIELNNSLEKTEKFEIFLKDKEADTLMPKGEQVTAEKLLGLFVERLQESNDLIASAKEIEYIPQGSKTEEEWNKAISTFAYDIDILRPATPDEISKNPNKNNRLYWEISVSGIRNKDEFRQLLQKTFEKANQYTRINLYEGISKNISSLESLKEAKLEDLEQQLENLRQDYKLRSINRILFLKEQGAIARKLGIAKNAIEAEKFGEGSYLNQVQGETPFYLRGYEAIEEEIAIIEKRTLVDEYINEAINLQNIKNTVNSDKSTERLLKQLKMSHINDDKKFESVRMDMSAIKFETTPTIIILFIFMLVGGLIGILFTLIRKIM